MTWSEEVHASRLASSLAAARSERARAKGQQVQRTPDAGPAQLLFYVGATSGLILWQTYRPQLQKVKWSKLPVLRQFHDLVYGSKGTKLGPAGGQPAGSAGQSKSKSKKNKKKAGSAMAAQAQAPATQATSVAAQAAAPRKERVTVEEVRQSLKPSGSLRVPSGGGAEPPSPKRATSMVPSRVVTNPAPLQNSAVAPFLKPHQPLTVETTGQRVKPAAKPAAVTSGLVRVPSNKTP